MTNVLIIAADAPARTGLVDAVSREGHRAVVASSEAAAREHVEREPIAVVVVDLTTIEIDGPALLQAVDARTPPPPLLVIVDPGHAAAQTRAFRDRVSAVMPRPIDAVALGCNLRTLVELGRLRAARPSPADRSNEARYQAMVAAMPDLLFRLDRAYRFVDVSASDPSQLALPTAALLGKTVAEIFGEGRTEVESVFQASFAGRLTEAIDRALASGELQRFEYGFRDRWYEARVVRSAPDEVLAIARDLTALREVTQDLERSRSRLDFLVNTSPAVIYTCNAAPPFGATFISSNVLKLMGWRPEEFIEHPGFWAEHIHPEDAPRVLAQLSRVFEMGVHEHEYRFRLRGGEYRWMRDVLYLVRDASGAAVEMIGSWTDITERRHAEDALRVAVRARDELLAVVSHDLRSPLTTVRLAAELLAQAPREAERRPGRDQVELILRSTDRMARLIDDLLQAATIESGTFTVEPKSEAPRSLVDEVVRAIEPVATVCSVRVQAELPATLPAIWGDRQRLIQVLLNLLGNAVKFSPKHGTVQLRARVEDGVVLFSVSDQGPGIPEGNMPHVFERYWTRKHGGAEGTGLGLYIAQGIVSAHGGQIWVESQVGAGSTFFFTVPLVRPAEHDASQLRPPESLPI